MSFAIIRNAKYKISNLPGISRHNERQNENFSNKDIDVTKRELNYYFRKPVMLSYEKEFYRIRQENNLQGNLRLTGTKQSNVVCEFLITSDNDFFAEMNSSDIAKYFETAYKFACQKCGEKNIISAVVHLDETTPHMHLTFIPVVKKSNKKGVETDRINCSEFWKGYNSYGQLQDDFHTYVTERGYNLARGEIKEDKLKHLSVDEYKLKTTEDSLKNALKGATNDLDRLRGIDTINATKLPMTSKMVITEGDYYTLKIMAKAGMALYEKLNGKDRIINNLTGECNNAKSEVAATKIELDKTKSELKTAKTDRDRYFDNYNLFLKGFKAFTKTNKINDTFDALINVLSFLDGEKNVKPAPYLRYLSPQAKKERIIEKKNASDMEWDQER